MDHTTLLPPPPPLPPLSSTMTATAVTARTAVASAATTVVTAIGRGGSRNGTHRTVNVHGRLMYDEIVINDVWINAILSTLAFTCAACLCVCFLYCKFQQWKHAAQQRRDEKNSRKYDNDSLPSYTIVTGLPTYEEAIERMNNSSSAAAPPPPPPPPDKPSAASSAAASSAAASSAAASATTLQVYVKDERRTTKRTPSKAASCCPAAVSATSAAAVAAAITPADPAKKFGLVSRAIAPAHDGGCSHCLSVQELLETYNVR